MDANEVTRYTLLLESGALKAIERLQTTYGLKNKAKAYELAVQVLSWVADQQAQGHAIGRFVDGTTFQSLLLPAINPDAWRRGATAQDTQISAGI